MQRMDLPATRRVYAQKSRRVVAAIGGFKLCSFCERSLCPPPDLAEVYLRRVAELESSLADPDLRDGEGWRRSASCSSGLSSRVGLAPAAAFGLSSPSILRGPGGQGFERKNPAWW